MSEGSVVFFIDGRKKWVSYNLFTKLFQESFRNENILFFFQCYDQLVFCHSDTDFLKKKKNFYQPHTNLTKKTGLSSTKKSQTFRTNTETVSLPQPVIYRGGTFMSRPGESVFKDSGSHPMQTYCCAMAEECHSQRLK